MKNYIERNSFEPTVKYPCLKESRNHPGLIVRFTKPKRGVAISNGEEATPLFYFSEAWAEDSFKPFYGKVIFES